MQNIKDLAASSAKTWGEIAQVIDNNFKGTTDAQKNDLNYVRALDANRNPILISKADLASVVGGLLDSMGVYPFMDRGLLNYQNCKDLNDLVKAGYYWLDASTGVANFPDNIHKYGILEIISASGVIVQKYTPYETLIFNGIICRIGSDGDWKEWKYLPFQ